jgi:hypothetical protein
MMPLDEVILIEEQRFALNTKKQSMPALKKFFKNPIDKLRVS